MSLIINHNMMAANAARNLSDVYNRLSTSTQRLSSGLRINSAADDAAGLAIRELMRADIAVLNQGNRNAADAISMIQTAEGALSVIDEKLIRMKELAEQAATGTYTTVQREIMDSEYQAMASEIDRIANATDFNGIKLLDGSLSSLHNGSGIKIHFGTGNVASEDYYFVNIADSRATEATGLQVGGGATRDVWQSNTTFSDTSNNVSTLNTANSAWVSFYYDNDGDTNVNQTVATNPSNLVGAFRAESSLDDLVTSINQGAAARVQITFSSSVGAALVSSAAAGNEFGLSLGEGTASTEILLYNSTSSTNYSSGASGTWDVKVDVAASTNVAVDVASAINIANSADTGQVFAIANGNSVFIFAKNAGVGGNTMQAIEMNSAGVAGNQAGVSLVDVSTGSSANGANSLYFSMGGEQMVTAAAVQDGSTYKLQVSGVGRGPGYDISVVDFGAEAAGFHGVSPWAEGLATMNEATDFTETQNSSGQTWAGGDILTQSGAQQALDQIQAAILSKDKTRAGLGALQNRLENTMTNISIQAEMLQSSESRISDVDVATEMTEFTRNNIMAQAATAMLSQANSAAKLALSLLGQF